MKYLWGGCFVLVAVLALGITPWDAVMQVLENQGGVGDEQVQLLAAILAVAGWLSTGLGLGLAPGVLKPVSGPLYVSIPMMVFRAYVSTYGWALAWSALAIGFVGGLHIEVSYRESALGETTAG